MQESPLTTQGIREKLNLYDFPFYEMPDKFVEYVFPTPNSTISGSTYELESLGESVLKAIAALYSFRHRGKFNERTKHYVENAGMFLTSRDITHHDDKMDTRVAHILFGSLYSYLEGSRGYENSLEAMYTWYKATWVETQKGELRAFRPAYIIRYNDIPERDAYEDRKWTSYDGIKLGKPDHELCDEARLSTDRRVTDDNKSVNYYPSHGECYVYPVQGRVGNV